MIIGNYKIESDGLNIILAEHSIITETRLTKKENIGAERWANIGYYGSLTNALNALAEYKLNHSDMATVKAILDAIAEVKALISSITGQPVSQSLKTLTVSSNPIDHTDNKGSSVETYPLDVPVTRGRGRPKKLSPEHIAKMQAVRIKK